MAKKIRPLYDYVIVELVKADDITSGGIVIPDVAKERQRRGVVTATGIGYVDQDGKIRRLEVEKGDEVIFHYHAGTEITVDGSTCVALKEQDIIAVVE